MSGTLDPYFNRLESLSLTHWSGKVVQAIGNLIESEGPFCSVGECCDIVNDSGTHFPGEVVGFRGPIVLSMALDKPSGIRFGNVITTRGQRATVPVGDGLLGRVIDGAGIPIDGGGAVSATARRELETSAPSPLERLPIREPLGCGIRAVDSFLTCGRGQRVGIFGGSGVGKSTLIGMMTRGTDADLTVLALVGERGREVGEFLETIGDEGRRRSVVVVSTSDQSPLLRIRAALTATTIAEYFSGTGRNVLLVVDSLTRFAMAQREIGLAAGEPPTAKGYTPSVFSLLARVVERAGRFQRGSITAFYTVLMEGDDQQDPLVDTVRSLLDGHIVLDRRLAAQNHYPPISILDSLSRLMPAVASREHLTKTGALRSLLALYSRSEDLIRVGAYQRGSDRELDKAIEFSPVLNEFLRQSPDETPALARNVERLLALPS
ncbi:MAG TPA: FliI/YscN family ATPase [Clostridia bacterium]|nr:FliI/YscN family ATPase [Clostridia bacterium]